MNETDIYRKALEPLKSRIELFETDINPTAAEMQFAYRTMLKIITNALDAGDEEKKSYNKVINKTE